MTVDLRPFQCDAVDQIESEIAGGKRRPILVAPTGSGKTVVGSEYIKRLIAEHKSVLVVAHRREIITQTSSKLTANGVRHGIILAGKEKDLRPMERVQVASIQTLWARGMRSKSMQMPLADVIVFDEAHHARARTYQKILDFYPNAILLGLTATPCRGDGRGLGNIFDTLIECPQVQELIDLGFLVGTKIYAPVKETDYLLRGVRTEQGDYVIRQLEERMNTDQLVGDIVLHWIKYGGGRRTVCFAVDVAHSIHIRDEFLRAGVLAEHLDGTTPIPEREAILGRLESGDTQVVVNCMVLTEGWDMPSVGCCILARPTKQMGLYRQMVGRVLRPAEGKTDAIILDHAGAVWRHGRPEDPVNWTLDEDRRAENPTHKSRRGADQLRECPSCKVVMFGPPPCFNCGWEPAPPRGRDVEIADGELGLVEGGRARPAAYDYGDRQQWLAMLKTIAAERGYKPGWVSNKYKEKFGFYPAWGAVHQVDAMNPTPECRSWVRSRAIAWARSPANPRNQGVRP
jgi:DNA repair protein RadD